MKNIGLAVLTAVIAALVFESLARLINFITWVCFLGAFKTDIPDITNSGLGGWIILIPIAGAVAGALIAKFGKKMLVPLGALLMTGTGFPFGVEGTFVSGLFVLGEKKLLKAAALAGALAYMMHAPLAATVLVFELGFIEFTLLNVVAMLLSAATGALCCFLFHGWGAVFPIHELGATTISGLTVYFITGIVVSLFGILLTGLIKVMEKITYKREWLPVVAAVIIGYLGWLRPEGLGTGNNFLEVLYNGQMNLQICLGLSLVRFAMLALAAGSGAPGSALMITPLVLIGGALGTGCILLFSMLFGVHDTTFGVAAIVGVAALLTGRLPIILAAIILSIEITHQWMVILPVIVAVMPAFILRKLIVKNGTN